MHVTTAAYAALPALPTLIYKQTLKHAQSSAWEAMLLPSLTVCTECNLLVNLIWQ